MEIKSAFVGVVGTVVVAGSVFAAVAASNAQDGEPEQTVAPVGYYSTIESQDPIEWVAPEPEPSPEPTVEPVPVPVVEPEPVEEPVAPKPAPEPTVEPGVVILQPNPSPPDPYTD